MATARLGSAVLPAVPRRGQQARRGCVLIAEAGFSVRRSGRGGVQCCGYGWIWVGAVWRVCVGHDRGQPHNSHPQPSGENGSGGQFCQFGLSGAVELIGGGHDVPFVVAAHGGPPCQAEPEFRAGSGVRPNLDRGYSGGRRVSRFSWNLRWRSRHRDHRLRAAIGGGSSLCGWGAGWAAAVGRFVGCAAGRTPRAERPFSAAHLMLLRTGRIRPREGCRCRPFGWRDRRSAAERIGH